MAELEKLLSTDSKVESLKKINAIIEKGGGGTGLQMFDTILKDHILTYEESKGLALQGTYVYKEAVAGSRYGYADFYNKVVEEYNASVKEHFKSNITTTGSPLDSKGVLSGFSSTNYAHIDKFLAPNTSAWEFVVKTKITGTPTANSGFCGIVQNRALNLYFPANSNNITLELSSTNSSFNIGSIASTGLQLNTDYWLKVEFTGTEYNYYISTDGDVYNLQGTITSSTAIYQSNNILALGIDYQYNTANNFTIDLNESYININGERWWSGADCFNKNDNGHWFYDISEKEQIDAIFDSTGTAWFYGVDTENERVFLPRNNYFEQATADSSEVGQSVEAGLPNIEGTLYPAGGEFANPFGAASKSDGAITLLNDGTQKTFGTSSSSYTCYNMGIDASRSSEVYGNSDTVQPPAVKKLLYICVGNTESVSSVTDVVEVTTTENDTTPLFTGMYFDFTPNNLSWLKAGQQKNNEGIYRTCYNELVNELTTPKYGLKVINEADMIVGIDYSEYWKVNQDDMTFTTPTSISNKALSGAVAGNGMTLGLTDGEILGGLKYVSTNSIGLTGRTDVYGVAVGYVGEGKISFTDNHTVGVTTDPTKSGIIAEQSAAQLYFKVANAVQNLELLNAGEVLEAVADKISRQDCKAYITETYVNGNSWYRIYSDGWCEQGGIINSGVILNTVNLLKPYKDITYTVSAVAGHPTLTNAGTNVSICARTTTSFSCEYWNYNWGAPTGYECMWQACGYIA